MPTRRPATPFDLLRIRTLASAQFGPKAAEALTSRQLEVELRRGKIRYVYLNGERLMTLRPRDFAFTLSLRGAELIADGLGGRLKVVVDSLRSSSLTGDRVLEADPAIRPGDEVLIVDRQGRLVGVGKARAPGFMMRSLGGQEVVRVREVRSGGEAGGGAGGQGS